MKRRDFISFISSSLAFLSASCQRPEHKVVPAVYPSEISKPGHPVYYNSVCHIKNCAYAITIKTVDGKPIKIDGNFSHPSTSGVINPLIQATLYSLYDPKRFFSPQIKGVKKNKIEANNFIFDKIHKDLASGKTLYFFYNEHCSPSYQNLIEKIKEKSELIKFIRYSPFKSKHSKVNKQIFNIDAEFVPDFDNSDYIITFDADIFGANKLSPLYSKKIINRRNGIKKLICIESNYTLTGLCSDERYTLTEDDMFELIRDIYIKINHKGKDSGVESDNSVSTEITKNLSARISGELLRFGDKSVIIPGDNIDLYQAQMIMLINKELKNIGQDKTFNPEFILPFSNYYTNLEIDVLSGSFHSTNDCTIIFLETNPFYSGNNFLKKRLQEMSANDLISLSLYPDETYQRAGLKIPSSHYLEKWGDALFFDGYQSIVQPVIKPLNEESISSEEFLLQLFQSLDSKNETFDSYYDYLRDFHKNSIKSRNDWELALRNGFFLTNNPNYSIKPIESNKTSEIIINQFTKSSEKELFLKIVPSVNFFDDYEPDNPYLLELPDPITKITWENAGYISKSTAQKYELENGDVVLLYRGANKIEIPVYIIDLIADGTIIINSGFGRKIKNSEHSYGVNPFELTNFKFDEFSLNSIPVHLEKTNKKIKFAQSQTHFTENNTLIEKSKYKNDSIYPGYRYLGQKWGMVINLSKCTGCNSCVISCQFENNIPVVGKSEVINGRIMHWIKIDRYESNDNSESYFEPMLCQHCENAPCESVCPVGATNHSPEGINEMTYNRCIGARFCMVNCPYNVRRFNYENYYEKISSPLENMLNPEITTRMRGIAEKCTFCVQRINELRIDSKNKGYRFIPDGKLKTACQEACPTEAIIFGDLNDKNSKISELIKLKEISYKLEFLNTKPSVAYIRKGDKEINNA